MSEQRAEYQASADLTADERGGLLWQHERSIWVDARCGGCGELWPCPPVRAILQLERLRLLLAWAMRREYNETQDAEHVARRLGAPEPGLLEATAQAQLEARLRWYDQIDAEMRDIVAQVRLEVVP